jgi:hypothetical protein
MCFVWISEQTATFALQNIKRLVFITEVESVYSAVRTESLYKQIRFVFKGLKYRLTIIFHTQTYNGMVGSTGTSNRKQHRLKQRLQAPQALHNKDRTMIWKSQRKILGILYEIRKKTRYATDVMALILNADEPDTTITRNLCVYRKTTQHVWYTHNTNV